MCARFMMRSTRGRSCFCLIALLVVFLVSGGGCLWATWNCLACTLSNEDSATACGACNAARPIAMTKEEAAETFASGIEAARNNPEAGSLFVLQMKLGTDAGVIGWCDEWNASHPYQGKVIDGKGLIKQLPVLYQGYHFPDPSPYPNGNLCGWYAPYFLSQILALGEAAKLNDRHQFDTFLNNLISEGKPLNAHAYAASDISQEVVFNIVKNTIDGRFYNRGAFAMLACDKSKKIHSSFMPTDYAIDLKFDIVDDAGKANKLFGAIIAVKTQLTKENDVNKLKEFTGYIQEGTVIYGHWIAIVFKIEPDDSVTMYVADSLGVDRREDAVVNAAFDWFVAQYTEWKKNHPLVPLQQKFGGVKTALGLLAEKFKNLIKTA